MVPSAILGQPLAKKIPKSVGNSLFIFLKENGNGNVDASDTGVGGTALNDGRTPLDVTWRLREAAVTVVVAETQKKKGHP